MTAPAPEPIPFLRPEVPSLDAMAPYFARSEEMSFFSNRGPCERALTDRLSTYLDGAHCVLVSNCTLGLFPS